MESPSPCFLGRCCLRCWGLACLVPGALLLFWALNSLFDSIATVVVTSRWVHDTGWEVVERLPPTVQQWLAQSPPWTGPHALATTLVEMPLVLLLSLPGGVAVFVGLCLWEEARQKALDEQVSSSPALRTAPQLARRKG